MDDTRFLNKLLERIDKIDRPQIEDYMRGLIKENSFLLNSINRIDEGVIILDRNLYPIVINSTAEFLLGISGVRTKSKKITQFNIDNSLFEVLDNIDSISNDAYARELNTSFPRDQLLKIYICPLKESAIEETTGWVVTIHDITEYKRTNIQRFQIEKLKALITMAGILAHELGNPLNSLAIHIQLLGKIVNKLPKISKTKLSKLVKIAQTEVKRLDGILTRFLQATRPLKTRFFQGDVHNIIDETLTLLGPELKKDKIKVIKNYSKDVPKIYLDRIQMRQAFINIIKNAIEAIHKNGKIEIATKSESDKIKIIFKDNGAGIPEDELDKVFEPYYSSKSSGSGLGLVIVHRVIRDHGGQVEVKSKLGYGTSVIIYLPTEPVGPKLLTKGESKQ